MSTSIDIDSARATLDEERAKLVHQLDELGATESGDLRADVDYGDGFSDAAAATAERTERLGIVESILAMLGDVNVALAKIDDGTYGTCSQCGKTIGPDRIRYRPASHFCVDCKSKKS